MGHFFFLFFFFCFFPLPACSAFCDSSLTGRLYQSSDFLLVFTSVVILGFGPRLKLWPRFCSVSRPPFILKMGTRFPVGVGVGFSKIGTLSNAS
jgi:hypothetical protein